MTLYKQNAQHIITHLSARSHATYHISSFLRAELKIFGRVRSAAFTCAALFFDINLLSNWTAISHSTADSSNTTSDGTSSLTIIWSVALTLAVAWVLAIAQLSSLALGLRRTFELPFTFVLWLACTRGRSPLSSRSVGCQKKWSETKKGRVKGK